MPDFVAERHGFREVLHLIPWQAERSALLPARRARRKIAKSSRLSRASSASTPMLLLCAAPSGDVNSTAESAT